MKEKDGATIIVNTGGKRGGKTKIIQKLIENETVAKEKYTDDGVLIYEPEPHPKKKMAEIRHKNNIKRRNAAEARQQNYHNYEKNKKDKERKRKKMAKKSKRRNRK